MPSDVQPIRVYPRKVPKAAGPTCVDLFSGAGGLAVGFRDAGWAILAANDADADAGETFRLNFPESTFFHGPIRLLSADNLLRECGLTVGELDCLIGGPPCQSFSHNNHRRSASDDRARLFKDYLRLVAGLKPKMLVMENVPGILSIDGGSVIREIAAELLKIGYVSDQKTLSSEEFGTPQIRKRVFIVASRIGSPENLLPIPTHQSATKPKTNTVAAGPKTPVTVAEAIGDLPDLPNGGGSQKMARGGRAAGDFQKHARQGIRALYNHVCHTLTEVNLKRIEKVPEGGNWRDIPFDLLPAGMQRARKSDHTKRYGRLDRKGLASTILTKCDPHWGAYIHPTQNRTISVREAARLQGFPDKFRFAGAQISKHYEQVGNAVPVPVARAIAHAAQAHAAAAKAWLAEPADSAPVVVDRAA